MAIFKPIFCIFIVQYFVLVFAQDRTHRRTSNVCKTQFDCPLNAFCELKQESVHGYCVCREGFLLAVANNTSDRQCIPVAVSIGDFCEQDTQCSIAFSSQAECRDGACQCKENCHFRGNSCYYTAKIGERCQFNGNCYIGEEQPIFCTRGFCTCSFNQHGQDNGTRCVDNSFLGDVCQLDDDCVIPNSRCHKICRCQFKHVISQNGTHCLKAVYNLLEECTEEVQCTDLMPNTYCHLNQCICRSGHHQVDKKCWHSVTLRGFCEVDQQCLVEGAKCVGGVCACDEGLIEKDDQCSNAISFTSFTAITLSFTFLFINQLV